MAHFPDHAQLANLPFIEDLYSRYLADPKSVDASWRYFFEGVDFSRFSQGGKTSGSSDCCRIEKLISAYRRYGHLLVSINPIEPKRESALELDLTTLGFSEDELDRPFPTLGFCSESIAPINKIIESLQSIYSSRIGFEYMDLGDLEMERWIQNKIEPQLVFNFSNLEKKEILEQLNRAELFETFLHTKYVGQKRFSLEGNETLIPLLKELIIEGSQLGIETFVLGMAHRGRLNVLANILHKPYTVLFKEFEDAIELLPTESGDVKYHKGYSSHFESVELHLASNSSCLESVDGIVLGQTKALQILKNDESMSRVGAILMHGDAAMAGQGVFYEILQMGRVEGFATGGTIQIAVNNQIGYTTNPEEGRSTRYCTDIAKTFNAPVLHVNAEDPESCVWAARLAIEIRQKFQCDVFIDLNGYRKYGHNETDEPGFTHPVEYAQIRGCKTIRQKYLEVLLSEGVLSEAEALEMETKFKAELTAALESAKKGGEVTPLERFGMAWADFKQPSNETFFNPVATCVDAKTLRDIATAFCRIPDGFHIHPKLEKQLQQRLQMVNAKPSEPSIDWGMGECLAIGSLLWEGKAVRLSGQDSRRGTFSHRHAVWFDQETAESYAPYSHLKEGQPRCDIYNTILSEFGSMGFEFGYSWSSPQALVCWEAQYGDFVIGAEILIDHYLAAAEQKWARYSSLVLLLPHGYEGAGSEHSSARMERFLQLSSDKNIQVANPTTPAQYFHLLRRQALRPIKKPLIVFSPKSLLRLSSCTSALNDLTAGTFEEVLDDQSAPKNPEKILLCTGKIYYELIDARGDFPTSVIIRLEQIYPLHIEKLQKILNKYKTASQLIWVQEEPENMGAWEFLRTPLQQLLPPSISLSYAARPRSAASATGSYAKHKLEQEAILSSLKG